MRFGFLIKAAVAVILVASFDRLIPLGFTGATIGAFAAARLAGVAIARADVRRDPGAWRPLAMAALFAASLVDDPGVLGWTLFWCALAMAALWPRTAADILTRRPDRRRRSRARPCPDRRARRAADRRR